MASVFWQKDVREVATELIGKTLVVNGVTAEIVKAQPFRRKANEGALYSAMLTMAPGLLWCPNLRGTILFLVTALDKSNRGGCVLLREIKVGDEVVKGPGRVTKRLGVTAADSNRALSKHGNTFTVV